MSYHSESVQVLHKFVLPAPPTPPPNNNNDKQNHWSGPLP